jgi:hypothetical protein
MLNILIAGSLCFLVVGICLFAYIIYTVLFPENQ